MGPLKRLKPALLFATVGAGISLGVVAVLPVWDVPNVPPPGSLCPPTNSDCYSACPGTLWQAVLEAPVYIYCPKWAAFNALNAVTFLVIGGMGAADFYWLIVLPVMARVRARKATSREGFPGGEADAGQCHTQSDVGLRS
jgi:hypothetical protein